MLRCTILFLLQVSLGAFFRLPQLHLQVPSTTSTTPPPVCKIDIQVSALKYEPIVVDSSYNILYPTTAGSKVVEINNGETIIISCPGGFVMEDANNLTQSTILTTCESNTDFSFGSKTIDFRKIQCSNSPLRKARYTEKGTCKMGREIEVGYDLKSPDRFVRQFTICFDDVDLNSLYSSYEITRFIRSRETDVYTHNFVKDIFYPANISVKKLYQLDNQRTTINNLLSLPAGSNTFIKDNNYLTRGHYAAHADFVYVPQQSATYYYVNVAPQWKVFNGGNWNIAETAVKDYADKNGVDLKVYTGSYGVTTLPDKNNVSTSLYLYVDKKGNKKIAVPDLYWKIVYNPKTQFGVALLGVNNPYKDEVVKICKNDTTMQIEWLHWKDPTNKTLGYSYACPVDDPYLQGNITFLPTLSIKGLLL